jgi:hypothetical protein
MRIFSLFLFVSFLVLTSCSSDVPEKEIVTILKQDSLKDTIIAPLEIIEPNPSLDSLLSLFTTIETLPFSIEAKNIEKIKLGKKLRRKQVNMLATSVVKNDLFMDVDYAVEKFNIIDSVKAVGKYDEWKQQLDMGAVMYSKAFCITQVKTGENASLLLWMLDYQTEDACPFSYSKTIYATAIYKNKITETIVFAEQTGGADAPISFDGALNGTLTNDFKFVLSQKNELDNDEPKIEINEGIYELELKEGKFTFTKEEKKKSRFVKRKQN